MTLSVKTEELAAEAGTMLRKLYVGDLVVNDEVPTETKLVAVQTRDTNLMVSWLEKSVVVKGKMLQKVSGCIRASKRSKLLFTTTGVVLVKKWTWGRSFLYLYRQRVSCYVEVRASELSTRLGPRQISDLYATLRRVTSRQDHPDIDV